MTKETRSASRLEGASRGVLLAAAAMFASPAFAQGAATPPTQGGTPAPAPARVGTAEVHGQATWVGQRQFALRRRDQQPSGPASLRAAGERRATQTLTLFVGARVAPNLDVFVNPEAALGGGIANGGGLAAHPNGDLIGQQAFGDRAYLARCFVRWAVPLGGGHDGGGEAVDSAENQIGERRPVPRLTVRLGRMAAADLIDTNAYANNPRTQFLSNAFGNNLAFDFPQDVRGYTDGLLLSWITAPATLRAGSFALPPAPGAPGVRYALGLHRGDVAELEFRPRAAFPRRREQASRGGSAAEDAEGDAAGPTLRLLAWRNVATLGRYGDALALARASDEGEPPDLAAVRRRGAVRWGWGVNAEVPLADGGDTGLFARWGWADDGVESGYFAEADRFAALGFQVSGARWGRGGDRVGLGLAQSRIGGAHRDFLAAGGAGLALGGGDMGLRRYGPERVLEAYYSVAVSGAATVSLDWQHAQNPGYDRDGGTADLLALRLNTGF